MIRSKMFGDKFSERTHVLERICVTEKPRLIHDFALYYVQLKFIPLVPPATRMEKMVMELERLDKSYTQTEVYFTEIREKILLALVYSKMQKDNQLEALLRSIAQGYSTIYSTTHLIGMLYYGSAALSFAEAGQKKPKEFYKEYYENLAEELIQMFPKFKKSWLLTSSK